MSRLFRTAATSLLLASALLAPLVAAAASSPPIPAVVTAGVENLYVRPDETGPVDSQAILGERVVVLEDTAGFARVRTADWNVAWIPERSLRRSPAREPERVAEVVSPVAHLYREPSFTTSRPLLTAPLGARLASEGEVKTDGYDFLRVTLPDGRTAFVSRPDVALVDRDQRPLLKTPADWIALGTRFIGAPYRWGGTTPLGFDCSGLVQLLLKRHGVTLKRNSPEMCFSETKLLPVALESLAPGDLLFFGTESKIDHVAIWTGDGKVLESTSYGVPGTKVTLFAEDARLKNRFRYARRLALLPNAPKPGRPDPKKLATLLATLKEIVAGAGARFGVVFKDLTTGETVQIDADRVMHAASTMKTPVLLEVLRRADAGMLNLTDELPVRNEFRSLADGSPFAIGLDPETDGPTMAHLGKSVSLGFLIREMIVRSSNLATNVVLSHVGPESVQKLTDELGAPTVKVRRCVEDGKAFERGLNNETDARGMAAMMEACVRTPTLSACAKAKAWEILTEQTFNHQIPAGLHPQSGAVVGHKTGSTSSVQHDAAVIRLPDGREYVLVILANDFGASEEGRKRVIEASRKISRAVWEQMIAP